MHLRLSDDELATLVEMVSLAKRDLIQEIGPAALEALDEEERRKKAAPLEKRYWEKFQKDGTDLLFWIDRNEDA